MRQPWTSADEEEFQRLDSMSYSERSVDQEMRYEHLKARRNVAVMDKREAIRKSGPLHKPAIVVFLCGLGACGSGFASHASGLMLTGAVLLVISSVLNGLNDKLTRS